MTNKDLTLAVIVLDRSGSMASIKADTIGGFNTFIREQKKGPGSCRITFVQFDTGEIETIYDYLPIQHAAELTESSFVPRAGTPLLDAIGITIEKVGRHLQSLKEEERPGLVLFAIVTDGHENSSRQHTPARILEMIKHQETKYGWQFVYLGANQDAITVARDMGISMNNAMTYDAAHVGSTYSIMSSNTTQARERLSSGASGQSIAASLNFTERQRKEAVGEIDTSGSPGDKGAA